MAIGQNDPHGSGVMGTQPSQGVFIGWMAIGLLGFMLVFALAVLLGAMSFG